MHSIRLNPENIHIRVFHDIAPKLVRVTDFDRRPMATRRAGITEISPTEIRAYRIRKSLKRLVHQMHALIFATAVTA